MRQLFPAWGARRRFGMSTKPLLVVAALALVCSVATGASPQKESAAGERPGSGDVASIRITSPLGRTGVATKVRIVAQIHVPSGQALSKVNFYVDGMRVGTTDAAAYASVDWTDSDPFEPREIVVEAADAAGRTIRDSVKLPPFEVEYKTDVTSILLEAGVYDKTGRSISQLDSTAFTVLENGVPQEIDLVARETPATNLVLLVDNTQSMSRRMDFVRLATGRLAGTLRVHDRVIVAPFNAHIGTITGPTNDGPTITHAIAAMRPAERRVSGRVRESAELLQGVEGRRA